MKRTLFYTGAFAFGWFIGDVLANDYQFETLVVATLVAFVVISFGRGLKQWWR